MKIVHDDRIPELTSRFLPKEILKFRPVIAGGFAVWANNTLNYLDQNNIKWEDFLFSLDQKLEYNRHDTYTPKLCGKPIYVNDVEGFKHTMEFKFDDVDLWFIKEDINKMPSYYKKGFDYESIFTSRLWFRAVYDKVSLINEQAKKYMEEPFGKTKSKIKSSTDWANTYLVRFPAARSDFSILPRFYEALFKGDVDRNYYEITVQFIKKPIESVEELFEQFDIKNCRMAIFQDTFFLDESAVSAFRCSEMIINEEVSRETLIERINRATRGFKYMKRYKLEADDRFSNELFNLYLEVLEHPLVDSFKRSRPEGIFFGLLDGPLDTGYAVLYDSGDFTNPSPDRLKYYIKRLLDNFKLFTEMKNFDPFWISYFLGTEVYQVSDVVQDFLYEEEIIDAEYEDEEGKASIPLW